MGKPIGVKAKGQTIYVCCKGCVKEVEDNPEKYLETVKQQIKENEIKEKASTVQKQNESVKHIHDH
jgi:hypothetical protein